MLARRLMIGLAAGIAAAAVGVPLAGAGNRIVDDYWRDQAVVAPSAPDTIVDDYWRDGLRGVKPTPPVTDRIVDDYFRDPQPSVKATPRASNRIVDDYFRDAPAVVASGDGFNWGDFAIGIAVALGTTLVLAGLGAGVLALRQTRSEKPSPAETG